MLLFFSNIFPMTNRSAGVLKKSLHDIFVLVKKVNSFYLTNNLISSPLRLLNKLGESPGKLFIQGSRNKKKNSPFANLIINYMDNPLFSRQETLSRKLRRHWFSHRNDWGPFAKFSKVSFRYLSFHIRKLKTKNPPANYTFYLSLR